MRYAQLHRLFLALLLVTDVVAISGAFFIAWWIRFGTGAVPYEHYPPIGEYIRVLPVALAVHLIVFNYAGLYQPRRAHIGTAYLRAIVPAVAIAALCLFGLGFLYRGFSYSRLLVALMAAWSVVLLAASRGALVIAQQRLRKRGVGIRRIAILGGGSEAKALADSLKRHPGQGYRLAGYVGPGSEARTPYLGDSAELATILSSNHVDELLIVATNGDSNAVGETVAECRKAGVECRLLANVFGFPSFRLVVEDRLGLPLLSLRPWPLDRLSNRLLKRSADIVTAGAALVVLSPLFLIIALGVKLSSPGPVFFRQERVGRDGRRFQLLKFRSMRGSAEDETGPVWTAEDDPRRTRFGTFIRRFSADELPQLVNVLNGDMSMVGPRPEQVPFVEQFREKYPRYDLRHRVMPGLTGWAQVHGLRGNTSIEERTRYDLYYLENWSLWLDLKIVVRTALGMFHHRHAY